MMLMVTCPEWISGKESYIDCMHGGSVPDKVINSYCWISGTFSVRELYRDFDTQVGWDVSQTGVGPYKPGYNEIEVKAYYQWVPFVLFLQGLMFYIPHIIFKTVEEGKVKKLLGGLARYNLNKENRQEGIGTLAKYIVDTLGVQDGWSIRIFLAHTIVGLQDRNNFSLGGNIVQNKSEDVMLDEERVPGWLEYEVLHEGLRRVFVSLQ